jgi:protein-L-isoaspartate(D-aspartate) O-methyltransferase
MDAPMVCALHGIVHPTLIGCKVDLAMDGFENRSAERAEMLRAVERDFAETVGSTGIARPGAAVLEALASVPRHAFVPTELEYSAYDNRALPIGHGQTISQPFIVALMTELARLGPDDTVLEIGTGCGYQAAVLARLVLRVHSVEIVAPLSAGALERLASLGVRNVTLHVGDGHAGWLDAAPYDAVLVTAAPLDVPHALLEQLRAGGRLVLPLGGHGAQDLCVVEKRADGSTVLERKLAVQFVPMTGGPG